MTHAVSLFEPRENHLMLISLLCQVTLKLVLLYREHKKDAQLIGASQHGEKLLAEDLNLEPSG